MSSTQDERAALIALYDATGGDNWKNKTNWKTNQPLSEWFGVTTNNGNGQVIGLVLLRNKLSGPIPAKLAQLNSLKYLLLDGNELSGPIPVELAQLSNLEALTLADNAGLYAPADDEFRAWLTSLEFSMDNLDQPEPPQPPPSPAHDVSLGAIERLLDAVKPPSDPTQTLELLESFLGLAEAFKKKVGEMGDGAANSQVFAARIEKLQEDLTKIEKTIAEVVQQTEDAAQQRPVLEAQNANLEAELDAKNKERDAKNAERETKSKERDDQKAALEKRRSDLEEVKRLLAELEIEIPRIEAEIQQINDESTDLALRVDDTGQKFHDAVEGFLESQRERFGIIGQIGDMLRLHYRDDAQILKALQQWEDSEAADLNDAIDLVDEIAKNLGDLDRCLGALTKERDSTS